MFARNLPELRGLSIHGLRTISITVVSSIVLYWLRPQDHCKGEVFSKYFFSERNSSDLLDSMSQLRVLL